MDVIDEINDYLFNGTGFSNFSQVFEQVTANQEKIAANQADFEDFKAHADGIWMLLCGFLVFFMHAGFAMLEAGAVQSKNTVNILFKNILTVSIGAFGYYLFGYAFAYGEDIDSPFIGSGYYALSGLDRDMYSFWYFQMVFAATCATIVSGAVAERTKLEVYFLIAFYLVCFTYPIVSHWVWSGTGWLSAFAAPESRLFYDADSEFTACGMIDFAGSGVVHMVGGFSGLVGAALVGPRKNRFEITPTGKFGRLLPLPAHNLALCAIGTFILWFGWFGFNAGSYLVFDHEIGAVVAINTTLSPAIACMVGVTIQFLLTHTFDLGVALNCVLGGLVSITSGCSVLQAWHSIIVGFVAAFVYLGASALMKKLKIDDPLDAVAVHGCCGFWGVLVPGIFGTAELIGAAYDCSNANIGIQFATQLIGALAIIAWTVGTVAPLFLVLKYTMGLRVSEHAEDVGLDESEHGARSYEMGYLDKDMQDQEDEIKKHRQTPAVLPGMDSARPIAASSPAGSTGPEPAKLASDDDETPDVIIES